MEGPNNHTLQVYSLLPEMYDYLYSGDDPKTLEFIEWILEKYGISKQDRLLEIGSGTGNILIPLAKKGYNIQGMEPYTGMIEQAQIKARQGSISIKISKGGFLELETQEEYDFIFSINGPMHYIEIDDYPQAFTNILNALKPGGYYLVDLMNFYSLIKYYKYPEPTQITVGEHIAITNIHHRVDLEREKWIHHLILFLHQEDQWIRIDDVHEMTMVNLFQLKYIARIAGFDFVKYYSSYDERDQRDSFGSRLIAVFQKPDKSGNSEK